jgi:hypothetical protein
VQEQRKSKKKLNANTSIVAEVDDYTNFHVALTPSAKKKLVALHLDLATDDEPHADLDTSLDPGKIHAWKCMIHISLITLSIVVYEP